MSIGALTGPWLFFRNWVFIDTRFIHRFFLFPFPREPWFLREQGVSGTAGVRIDDVPELESRRRKRVILEEKVCQFTGILKISPEEPVDDMAFPFHFAEKDILPFGKLADLVEQLCAHFIERVFSLQEKRNFPVFQTE